METRSPANVSTTVPQTPRKPAGADHRVEDILFPPLQGWKRALALFVYYLVIIVVLLVIYGQGDFTTAPFVYQGF